MNVSVVNNLLKNRKFLSIFAIFFLVLFFFIANYCYYPGLTLSFEGDVDGQVEGRVHWDYGKGFNELDSIDVRLSAGFDEPLPDLGGVTVEAVGMKSDRAKGYGVWLVIDKEDFENNRFVLEGEHEWGDWIPYQKKHHGRQLKLGSGSKITFPGRKNTFELNILESPLAGIAKVSSDRGMVAYFDCYGKNIYKRVERYFFGQKESGKISVVIDPYRRKLIDFISLPQQKISGIKFHPQLENSIKEIKPAKELVLRLIGSSEDPAITVEKLIVNGRVIEWQDPRIVSSGVAEVENGRELHSQDSVIAFQGTIFSFEAVLSKNSDPSALQILLDGKETEVTRQSNTKNVHVVRANCPIDYSSLTLSSIQLKNSAGADFRHAVNAGVANDIVLSASTLSGIKQNAFHWGLLFVQIITAAAIALLLYWLSKLSIWREAYGLKKTLASVFYRHERWLFWGIFIAGMGVNITYLLAEWPGSMTPDSVEINREVKWLRFANHHPYIYGIFVLGLYNLFDSPLTVIIFQMICFHLLVGLFFYFLFREGVRLFILLPLYCLTLLSVPINLFNITMWKDIPFSTLVLFWAFFLTWLFFKKLYRHQQLSLHTRHAVFLSVLFFLVCTLRFNGLVLIPVIPLLLCALYWGQKRGLLAFFACSAVLLISCYSLVPFVTHHKSGHSDFAKTIIEERSNKMGAVLDTNNNYFLEDYLAERARIFVASLGTSPVADTWYTDTHFPPQEWSSVGEMRSDMHFSPQSNSLTFLLKKILKATTPYTGFFSGRFIFWNGLFALFGMCVAFLLYKWLPVSAFYSGFFLFQALCLFFFVWPRWRYLYFVYLGGVFLLPVIMLEIRQLQLKKRQSTLRKKFGEAQLDKMTRNYLKSLKI